MAPSGDLREPAVVGAIPRAELGLRLNWVARPSYGCPSCGAYGPMEVYVPAVRWPCAHTRTLPPLRYIPRPVEQERRVA